MGHWSSLFKFLPAQLVQQWSDASHYGIIVRGPPGCMSLDHFNLMGILFSVGVPHSWSILQLGTYMGLVGHFPDFWGLSFNVSFDKSERPVSICCNSGHMRVPAQIVGDIHPQVLGLRTGSRFLSKTGIWGSTDKPNWTFVYQTKYWASIWEGLKRFLLPKIFCFRHKFWVISHRNSVACILFCVSHLQSLFCQQQTGKHIFRGSRSRRVFNGMKYIRIKLKLAKMSGYTNPLTWSSTTGRI